MNAWKLIGVIMLAGIIVVGGCAAYNDGYLVDMPVADEMVESIAAAKEGEAVRRDALGDRRLVWNAALVVMVSDPIEDAKKAAEIAAKAGGYVDRITEGERSTLRLRVPSGVFHETVEALGALGKVDYKQISAEDVTMEMIDMEARLNNSIALRERLKQHLDRAESVRDILAIESELIRAQADIESMEARLKSLRGRVDMASIDLTLRRRRILGPIGYLFKGLFWGVEKLFVIQ